MAGNHWYAAGLEHVWLPYAQMKTMRPPLPVERTQGCRIVLADPDIAIDPRFTSNNARTQNRSELEAAIQAVFGELTGSEAIDRLTEAQIAYGSINSVHDLIAHPQLRTRPMQVHGRTVQVPAPAGWLAQVYPNPSTAPAPLRLLLQTERSGEVRLTLRDALGRVVTQQTAQVGAGATTLPLEAGAGLATGVYLLHVCQGEQQQVLKLVRQ